MKVLTVNYKTATAPKEFTESLLNTGFGVVANHPISAKLIHEIYAEWKDFFASEKKHQYLFDKSNQDGYFPMTVSEKAKGHDIKDIKEFYQIYPWGRYPAGLSSRTMELYEQMSALAAELLQWIEDHTPEHISAHFSMPLSQMIQDSPKTMLRILHYPPLTGTEEAGAIRAAAHEDINLITLLPAATKPGLQVQDTNGNWHDVACDPDTIVVNGGDMLHMCSQGYYPSTTHRVTNPRDSAAKEARLSMPLFLHPNDYVQLSITHTAKSYLHERLRELGLI